MHDLFMFKFNIRINNYECLKIKIKCKKKKAN